MNELKVLKTTVEIGLEKPVKFLHVTDTHLAFEGEWISNRWQCFEPADNRGQIENYFLKALAYAKEHNLFIVHTGDLIDFFSEDNFRFVDEHFNDVDYIYAAGNHDFCHWIGKAKEDHAYKWEMIKQAAPHFKSNLYFDSRIIGGVNFVTMDDSYYLLTDGQTDALKAEAAKGYPIILCMHVPLYAPELAIAARPDWDPTVSYVLGAPASGFSYWKVDWGKKGTNFAFRKMLTEIARQYAPELVVEHAIVKDIIPHSDVFRTYDVPAIMSIPMTMQKIAEFSDVPAPIGEKLGLINCEDEAYIAAAGGFTMGIMRHPYNGDFVDGKPDMSFPALHRNIKTKMYEVIRAVRWHRIAPAFSFCGEELQIAANTLCDTWHFENMSEEIESWWLSMPLIADFMDDNVLTKEAPAAIARGTSLPEILADENGYMPYCVTSRNPNGVFSVAALGRTISREYFIPKCDVTVDVKDSTVIGVFGEYKNLILKVSSAPITQVFMQDLADNRAFDVTDLVTITDNQIVIPGELISRIGTCAQPTEDTSEPGVVIHLYFPHSLAPLA